MAIPVIIMRVVEYTLLYSSGRLVRLSSTHPKNTTAGSDSSAKALASQAPAISP